MADRARRYRGVVAEITRAQPAKVRLEVVARLVRDPAPLPELGNARTGVVRKVWPVHDDQTARLRQQRQNRAPAPFLRRLRSVENRLRDPGGILPVSDSGQVAGLLQRRAGGAQAATATAILRRSSDRPARRLARTPARDGVGRHLAPPLPRRPDRRISGHRSGAIRDFSAHLRRNQQARVPGRRSKTGDLQFPGGGHFRLPDRPPRCAASLHPRCELALRSALAGSPECDLRRGRPTAVFVRRYSVSPSAAGRAKTPRTAVVTGSPGSAAPALAAGSGGRQAGDQGASQRTHHPSDRFRNCPAVELGGSQPSSHRRTPGRRGWPGAGRGRYRRAGAQPPTGAPDPRCLVAPGRAQRPARR